MLDYFKSGLGFKGRMASWFVAGGALVGWLYYEETQKEAKRRSQYEIFDKTDLKNHNRMVKRETRRKAKALEKQRKEKE